MATYEYNCSNCGNTFHVERPMSADGGPLVCDCCGGQANQVFTVPKLNLNHWQPDYRLMTPENAEKEWIAGGGEE